ncbi:hydroxylysine kinase-like [Adelges cooleyi]|uniref:hydroxylysine kinase-like n=1 Tax=Adelges cooleyi TaxID=133065 RepID=UPI00217FC6C8|nr:hydroxylysine kinase-like [Adelges cooleyi]XP_050441616.1 hydroxylysine kinase-like [Adelges cooleyi]XP_050441617.1 hydroxylysine kinase-like [Adelges cooleyi]
MADVTEDMCAAVDDKFVQDILENDYGFINGQVRKLDGYDDKNFHITNAKSCSEGIKFPSEGVVIKFVNSVDAANISLMEAQTKLMQHLSDSEINFPTPMLNKNGQGYRSLVINGKTHVVRMCKYIEGITLENVQLDNDLADNFGSCVGYLTNKFRTFDHEGFHRQEHIWALENAANVLKFIDVFDEQNQRDMIKNVLNKFQSSVLSQKDLLEKSIIHGDLSFNNIIVKDKKVRGVIDFGDVVWSLTFFELAVSLCYLIIQEFKNDNPSLSNVAIRPFIKAYQRHRSLSGLELSLLHTSVCARICQSLVLGKKTSLRDLTNLYVLSTQNNGWKALISLLDISEEQFAKLVLQE